MLIRLLLILTIVSFTSALFAQSKKAMTPDVYTEWNRIRNTQITDNGDWVMYQLTKEQGDNTLKIYNTRTEKTYTFNRSDSPRFDKSGEYAIFKIKHNKADERELRRKKTKKEDMPNDTLAIYHLADKNLLKIGNVKSFKTPKDWGGYVAYRLTPNETADSLLTMKKESDKTGTRLLVHELASNQSDTLYYAEDYMFAEEGKALVASSLGTDSTITKGVYYYDFEARKWNAILEDEGKISKMNLSKDGSKLAFLADRDTTKERVRPYELFLWEGKGQAKPIVSSSSNFLPKGYTVSHHTSPRFSEDNSRLLFSVAPPPILQDTSILDDEIVNVEVWNYKDTRLYTRQENNLSDDKSKDYGAYYDVEGGQSFVHGYVDFDDYDRILLDEENSNYYGIALVTEKYDMNRMWNGHGYFDAYRIDLATGKKKQFATKERGFISRSPSGNYAVWYNNTKKAYFSYDVENDKTYQITNNKMGVFYDELNDRPMDPWSYGYEAFTSDESHILIYDRYDVWLVPTNKEKGAIKLTDGRAKKTEYRIVELDEEERTIDISQTLLLTAFNEVDKSESYVTLDANSKEMKVLLHGNYSIDGTPVKAKNSDDIITTIATCERFPDLVHTTMEMKDLKTISNANPQQKDYRWHKVSLRKWKSYDGNMNEGLLYVPEDFDPKKKYPLLVNFYERSSDRLHIHRAPSAGRSTINYSYYTSKGYVIFNPDVTYEIGHPGKSCYDDVMSGVASIVKEGFIDEDRMALQGHSWGGYQIADLLTKTDIFKCAEAGAPVVNMVSAYGGIRWGSGMSRMFQYEKTQSRLGGTLWEKPELYLENSPIFNLDKVTTPVLILHNDEDGAVPWYQGIEYFNGLRRLGKPAWLLNYNGEPHWPVKWQNRLDFNIRLEQFFDHYLMDAPMPRWMDEGVPAIKKGIDQGYELIKED